MIKSIGWQEATIGRLRIVWFGGRGDERRSKANLVVISCIGDRAVPQDYALSRQHTAIKPGTDFSASTG
jgi:hypothetical protein